ncbi:hypothetical protein Taro_014919 [Colocasia esculenta]|uniref:Uncharacterized protein n=1 Tax=Colocasia esculenta TaxID=4460 RepID=A0A843URM7_COLES|nr:hypothetical protein [Colocasia esculenta]
MRLGRINLVIPHLQFTLLDQRLHDVFENIAVFQRMPQDLVVQTVPGIILLCSLIRSLRRWEGSGYRLAFVSLLFKRFETLFAKLNRIFLMGRPLTPHAEVSPPLGVVQR